MVFEYKERKYCINCDWLQYSALLTEDNPMLNNPQGFRIEKVQGNNVFKHRALVYDSIGRKWLTLLWCPFSSRINPRIMTVQVGNEFLYGGVIHESFRLLQSVVDCTFNSMGRIDLCCDFECDNEQLKLLNGINDGSFYIQGKKEGSVWWHAINGGRGFFDKQVHCLTFGSPSSEIKLKIYCKARELGLTGSSDGRQSDEDEHKPYIIEEWKSIGMKPKKVWRIEFSLSGANQLRSDKHALTLDNVASSEWQMQTFFDLYFNRCVIRKNQGRKVGHKNLDERLYLVDLPKKGNHLKWFEGNPPSPSNCHAIPIVRSMMNKITEPAVMANDEVYTSYASTIETLVVRNGLSNWFRNRFGDDCHTYFENLYLNVGSQVVEDYVDARKFFD